MSYITIDQDNQKLTNMNEEKITKKKKDHRGVKNPHFGFTMTKKSKEAISRSQKARYELYKNALANIISEERVREITLETLNDYLKNDSKNINNKTTNILL